MPTFRGTFFFSTDDQEGWTENYYIQEVDIATAATSFAAWIPNRMALSPATVSMDYAKVSDVAVKGDSLIAGGPFPIVGTYVPATPDTSLEANTALLIVIGAGAAKHNRIFLRGLTLDVVTGRSYRAPGGFATALTAYLTPLIGFAYVRQQVKPHTVPPTYTYTVSTAAFLKRVSARKPGRPFALPVGRKFSHRAV